MKLQPASLVIASLLALSAAGCSTAPTQEPAQQAAATPAKPMLSEQAKAALAEADAAVKTAKANFTLWIPVEKAYEKAEAAAKVGDSATVLKETAVVLDLNKIATAQTHYPTLEMK